MTATLGLPRADLPEWQQRFRAWLAWLVVSIIARSVVRLRLEGREHLVDGPAMYCFNHMGWADPGVILATFPRRIRLFFYGPKEETMSRGARNHLIWWTGVAVPFKPGKDDLLTSVKKAQAIFAAGASLAIAGEGAIHVHEGDLLPLHEGAAYLALRAGVPIVPVALTGTSLLGFRRLVRVRVGAPIPTAGVRPTHEAIEAFTWRTWHALRTMVADDRDLPVPGPFGRWLSDLFNDWGPGGRSGASEVRGPSPDEVPALPDGTPRAATADDSTEVVATIPAATPATV
ncbi:MAG: 1-acyl-sn-glycerol-3-phosphate acyltransferase [Chloroflexi bacterium]|nr:1-acyl-sn-glycerol-3-phosphate acyltransferase [Chloroflexota bacterium]